MYALQIATVLIQYRDGTFLGKDPILLNQIPILIEHNERKQYF